MSDESKECKSCRETRPLDAFPVASQNTDGRLRTCRSCYRIKHTIRRLARARSRLESVASPHGLIDLFIHEIAQVLEITSDRGARRLMSELVASGSVELIEAGGGRGNRNMWRLNNTSQNPSAHLQDRSEPNGPTPSSLNSSNEDLRSP